MIKSYTINEKNFLFFYSNYALLILLCSLFCSIVSAQIYQEGDVKIHISKGTTVVQNKHHKSDSAYVYISSGTVVVNFESKTDSISLNRKTPKKLRDKRKFRKNIKLAKQEKNEKKHTPLKLIITKKDNIRTLFLDQLNKSAISVISHYTPQIGTLQGEINYINIIQFTNINIIEVKSICIKSCVNPSINSIRPPPHAFII